MKIIDWPLGRCCIAFNIIFFILFLASCSQNKNEKHVSQFSSQEYINAAEPLLKDILQEHYPETEEQKKIVDFQAKVIKKSIWEDAERSEELPKGLVEPGGRFIIYSITLKRKNMCPIYTIEIYVSPDLKKTKVTYSDTNFPGHKYRTSVIDIPPTDQECGKQQKNISSAEFADMGFGTIK